MYRLGLHRYAHGSEHPSQHERQMALPGQHLRGAVMAEHQVRRGVLEGLRGVLQSGTPPPGFRLPDTLGNAPRTTVAEADRRPKSDFTARHPGHISTIGRLS